MSCFAIRSESQVTQSKMMTEQRPKKVCTWVFNVLTWKGRNATCWLFIICLLLLEKPQVVKKIWKVSWSGFCSETCSRYLLLFQSISKRWRARCHGTILPETANWLCQNLAVCLLKKKMKQTNIENRKIFKKLKRLWKVMEAHEQIEE